MIADDGIRFFERLARLLPDNVPSLWNIRTALSAVCRCECFEFCGGGCRDGRVARIPGAVEPRSDQRHGLAAFGMRHDLDAIDDEIEPDAVARAAGPRHDDIFDADECAAANIRFQAQRFDAGRAQRHCHRPPPPCLGISK